NQPRACKRRDSEDRTRPDPFSRFRKGERSSDAGYPHRRTTCGELSIKQLFSGRSGGQENTGLPKSGIEKAVSILMAGTAVVVISICTKDSHGLPTGMSAIRQAGMPALRHRGCTGCSATFLSAVSQVFNLRTARVSDPCGG